VDQFLSLTVLGVCTASIFALAASGLVLTYTTTGIFNFSHGAIGMLGAFAYWQIHDDWGWPTPIALVLVLGVLAPLLGMGIERGIMRFLTDAPETVRIVVTISLLVALLGVGFWLWPAEQAHPTSLLFGGESFTLFKVGITYHRASGVVLGILVALGLRVLLYRTRVGLDMRAAVDSRSLAMLNGARPDRSASLAWAIGCSTAALAGILIAPALSLNHISLTLLIVSAYAAAMIGRLRSLPMTFVGALILGLADSYAIGYIPTTNAYFSAFRFAIPALLLFIVLLVLPNPQLRSRSIRASKEEIPRTPWKNAFATAAAIVMAAVVLANVLGDADSLRVAKIFGIALIALSLVPLTGFGGQISLCQMSFAGIGAIVMAHHGQVGQPVALVFVALICCVVGGLVALPALRLSGIYLALCTAAFALFLDVWVFRLPAFDLGPWNIKFFDVGIIAVKPLDVPGVNDSSNAAHLVVLSVVFALFYLLVVGVRHSKFGERLLAMKDSPAACATLGLDVTRLKLAVFGLSAAMAGVGGALFAGTQGSVSPDRFSLFESLPLLLLAVVGGIGTAAGALFAGLILGGLPILIGIWPGLASLNRLLPGTMGVALGRNPNGAVHDLSARYRVLLGVPSLLAGLVVALMAASALAMAGVISGWGLTFAGVLALGVFPPAAEFVVARRNPGTAPPALEWAGIDGPFTGEELERVNEGLHLEEVSV
jgi:branched-chain amino acid transport system permease protein